MLKQHAHKNALQWLQDDFYWSENDPTCPFGSFEGGKALEGYQKWRTANPNGVITEYISDFLQKIAKIDLKDYNETLLDRDEIESQIQNRKYDDYRNIFSVDVSLIAIGLGQLLVDGKIDAAVYPILYVAMERLMLWNELQNEFDKTCENHLINLYNMRKLLESMRY